jgi:hypothetical protein
MNSHLDAIEVQLPEFNFFQQLTSNEKFLYLTEIYDLETRKNSDIDITENLQTFFDDITELQQYDVLNTGGEEFDKVDVLVDNENLVLESNSLSAVRQIKNRFMDEGYVLARDSEIEKMFKKNKITRYLRVYKIIGRVFHLCYN